MGLEFDVSPHVLIPRQDTEILVEEALKLCEGKKVLDMCTGSGCIIISIAKLGKSAGVAAVDISAEALNVAKGNAAKNEVKVEFIESDLFEKVEGDYDIIVSNPPYIRTKVMEELMPEVKDHEPVIALDGSKDGLYFYRKITASLKQHLRSGGTILYEIGYDQGEAVRDILKQEGFTDILVKKDLSGLDRVVTARRP
jgi:release factor glutamine methyltransferase